jgi:PRTRC genetic system ThiF family protein
MKTSSSWKVSNKRLKDHPTIMVVGCGGTGGFVAEGLCRLLVGKKADIILVDHDRVERHNLRRQCFYESDMGKFKSQALAERLSRLYGREIAFSVCPYSRELDMGDRRHGDINIIIGCVDNAAARESIADFHHATRREWWIDAGNGQHSGQVLVGNDDNKWPGNFAGCFTLSGEVETLPMPTIQQPSLLIPTPKPKRQIDCAQAVEADEQSPVINQAMAMLVLEMVSRFLAGTLDYMGVYIDLDAGTMSRVPVTPKEVARIMGIKERHLMETAKKSKKGAKR